MPKSPPPTKAKQPLTPLWVISLFISLTETVLRTAVIKTTGGIQMALTAFVIVFPVLIAAGFFLLLWYKPHHLYAPSDYSNVTGVRDYVEAITRRADDDASAKALHRYWKPKGMIDRTRQIKLRQWLAANDLKEISLTVFLQGDVFKTARQKALRDLEVPKE